MPLNLLQLSICSRLTRGLRRCCLREVHVEIRAVDGTARNRLNHVKRGRQRPIKSCIPWRFDEVTPVRGTIDSHGSLVFDALISRSQPINVAVQDRKGLSLRSGSAYHESPCFSNRHTTHILVQPVVSAHRFTCSRFARFIIDSESMLWFWFAVYAIHRTCARHLQAGNTAVRESGIVFVGCDLLPALPLTGFLPA